jgi:outer membrane protein W
VATSYAQETNHSLGGILSVGFDYLLTKKISVQLTGNYTSFVMAVPSSPWASRSKTTVSIDSFGAEAALAWHW